MHPIDLRQPRLNFDILRSVCNCLNDIPDILSFALTCSDLRTGALQRCLGMSPVVLSNGESIKRFHDFVFADTAARAPYIYGLKFPHYFQSNPSGEESHVTIQGRLVAILQAATRLEYLFLPISLGDSVIAVAGKITTLRELSIAAGHNNHTLHQFLTTSRSPLRYLHIKQYDHDDFSASSVHDKLAHFAPTLEVLKLDGLLLNIKPSSVTTQFTSLLSLEVHSISNFRQLSVLLRLFPNLNDTLVIRERDQCPEHLHQGLREQNKAAQKTRRWPRLDHVVCDIDLAFVMALECPIRRMDLEGLWYELRHLEEILHHNCPRQLHFPLAIFGSSDTLDSIFPPSAADRLTHLVMFVDFEARRQPAAQPHPVNMSWDRLIDLLVSSMTHLRLTHLRIVFHYTLSRSPSKRTEANDAVPDEQLVSVARESDLQPAATRFLDTIPTLEHVLLTTCGRTQVHNQNGSYLETRDPWLASKAWRVVAGGVDEEASLPAARSPSLVEIDAEEAAVVIGREELELSRAEAASLQYCRIAAVRTL